MPPLDEIRKLISYEPDTGAFRWLRREIDSQGKRFLTGRCLEGQLAGSMRRNGYVFVGMTLPGRPSKNFPGHRLAWALYHGEWPSEAVDHINRNRADNRIANLRLACRSQNTVNGKLRSNNTSGHKGVALHKASGKWVAQITKDQNHYHLGSFSTMEEALAVRRLAALELFGEYATERHGENGHAEVCVPSVYTLPSTKIKSSTARRARPAEALVVTPTELGFSGTARHFVLQVSGKVSNDPVEKSLYLRLSRDEALRCLEEMDKWVASLSAPGAEVSSRSQSPACGTGE